MTGLDVRRFLDAHAQDGTPRASWWQRVRARLTRTVLRVRWPAAGTEAWQ